MMANHDLDSILRSVNGTEQTFGKNYPSGYTVRKSDSRFDYFDNDKERKKSMPFNCLADSISIHLFSYTARQGPYSDRKINEPHGY